MSKDWEMLLDYTYDYVKTNEKKIEHEDNNKIVYNDGTKYHKDNRLNCLTSKEWLLFQKSWFILKPESRSEDVKLHPAKYPEELVSNFVKFFTKPGEIVLDPMVGTGSTLVACAECGRSGFGIELQEKYAKIAKKRIKKITHQTKLSSGDSIKNNFKIIRGDAEDIPDMNLPQIDYVITSPPYWDMLKEDGFETQEERRNSDVDVYYSDKEEDVGNIEEYREFLDKLVDIYKHVIKILKPKGYMTIVVKNVKKKGTIYPLAWDLASKLREHIALKDEKIWCQDDVNLAPYGYKYAWVSNTSHHYCLNFRKE